jgi:hypothetical protein
MIILIGRKPNLILKFNFSIKARIMKYSKLIEPKEMTSEMKSRIKQNIRTSRVKVHIQHILPSLF